MACSDCTECEYRAGIYVRHTSPLPEPTINDPLPHPTQPGIWVFPEYFVKLYTCFLPSIPSPLWSDLVRPEWIPPHPTHCLCHPSSGPLFQHPLLLQVRICMCLEWILPPPAPWGVSFKSPPPMEPNSASQLSLFCPLWQEWWRVSHNFEYIFSFYWWVALHLQSSVGSWEWDPQSQCGTSVHPSCCQHEEPHATLTPKGRVWSVMSRSA